MTAEFVVALPAALIVIVTALAGVQLGATTLRLHDAAAVAARSIARGDGEPTASARASALVPGLSLATSRDSGLVCVSAGHRGSGLLAAVVVSARSCTLVGSQ